MTSLAILAVWLLSATPQDQEPLSQNFELKAGSGNVYMGGGIRAEFKVEFKFLGVKSDPFLGAYACTNSCKGQKHLAHPECDTSCDIACESNHVRGPILPTWVQPNEKGWEEAIKAAEAHGLKGSLANQFYWHVVRRGGGEVQGPGVQLKWRCWNKTPCSTSKRCIKYNVYSRVVHVKISREQTAPDGTMTVTPGGQFDAAWTELWVPTEEFVELPPVVNCRCSVVKSIKDGGDFDEPTPTPPHPGQPPTEEYIEPKTPLIEDLEPPNSPGLEPIGFEGPVIGTDENGIPVSPNVLQQFNFKITLDDMNGGEVTCENPFPVPFDFWIPAGSVCDTDNDGVQDCLIIRPCVINLPSLSIFSPDGPVRVTAKLRTMCMELSKHEPSKSTKFSLMPNSDPVLARIGHQISRSRFIGSWDQAKIWIYTDGATYEDIQKRLLPAPGKGSYARALYEAAVAGTNFDAPKWSKCIEPTLLTAYGSKGATVWLAHRIARTPARLSTWVRSGASEMAQLLGPSATEQEAHHFARVVSIFAASQNVEAQRAAIAIMSAVPSAAREKLAKETLMSFWLLCLSEDKAIAGQALKLLNAWNPPEKEIILLNVPK